MSRSGVLVLLALSLLAGCARAPDEQRIREAIAAMQTAVAERAPQAFLRHVGVDFTGNQGDLDRDGIANLLRLQMLRHASINALIGPIDIAVSGDRATADFPLTLAGGSGSLLPDSAGQYRLRTGWRRDGAAWRCYHARWERVL